MVYSLYIYAHIYIYIVINWISKNWCTPFICSYLIKIKITSQNVISHLI